MNKPLSYLGASLLFFLALPNLTSPEGHYLLRFTCFISFVAMGIMVLPIPYIRAIKRRNWIMIGLLLPIFSSMIMLGDIRNAKKDKEQAEKRVQDSIKNEIKLKDSLETARIEDSIKSIEQEKAWRIDSIIRAEAAIKEKQQQKVQAAQNQVYHTRSSSGVCGAPKKTGGYCQNRTKNGGRCHHQGG
jgi:hypothetical protein